MAAVTPLEEKAKVAAVTVQYAQQRVAEAMKELQAAKVAMTNVTTQVDAAKKAAATEKGRLDELNAKLTAAKKSVTDSTAEVDRETKALETQKKTVGDAEAERAKRQVESDKRAQAFITATATRDRAAANVPKHEAKIPPARSAARSRQATIRFGTIAKSLIADQRGGVQRFR